MRVLVFLHLACEHPGMWREFLREDGAEVVTVNLDMGDAIPPLEGTDALLPVPSTRLNEGRTASPRRPRE